MKKTVKIIAFVLIICCCCSTLASCKPQGKCNYVSISFSRGEGFSNYYAEGYIADCYNLNDNYFVIRFYYVKGSDCYYAIAYKPHVTFFNRDGEPKNLTHKTKSSIMETIANDLEYDSIKKFKNGIKVSIDGEDTIYFNRTLIMRE